MYSLDEPRPSDFESDLVHHWGVSASGRHVHTLQMIDVATSWSERVATLSRGSPVMQDAFECILARLPLSVVEIHPDNGGEFYSHSLRRFWRNRFRGVQLSSSRPFQRHDNRLWNRTTTPGATLS